MERLADPRRVAVSDDPEAHAEEAPLYSVALDVLIRKETNQRLCCGQPHGSQRATSVDSSRNLSCNSIGSRFLMIKPNSCVRVLLRDRDEAVVAGVWACRDSRVRHGVPEPAATVGGA